MKRLFAAMTIAAVALPVVGVTPAQAGKAPVGILFTDEHAKTGSGKVKGGGTCDGVADATKKACRPWAELPAWPTVARTVKDLGGHFHVLYPTIPEIQEVSLQSPANNASVSVNYGQIGCGIGQASGTLGFDFSNGSLGVPPDHGLPRKATGVLYDVDYLRLGEAAILVATAQAKTEVVVALLQFTAKEPAANTVNRCVNNTGGQLKVEFRVAGITVNV